MCLMCQFAHITKLSFCGGYLFFFAYINSKEICLQVTRAFFFLHLHLIGGIYILKLSNIKKTCTVLRTTNFPLIDWFWVCLIYPLNYEIDPLRYEQHLQVCSANEKKILFYLFHVMSHSSQFNCIIKEFY